jgi:hypothetical protein
MNVSSVRSSCLWMAVLLLSACSPESEEQVLPAAEMKEQSGLVAEDRPILRLDSGKVPADLQDLIPYAEKWGIGGDISRSDFQGKAADSEKQALQAALKGRNARITAWLDEQSADGMSEEAAAFMYMQLALDEMGLWTD